MQSVLELLYKHLPRSESNNAISAKSSAAYPNSARSTLFDRGWQQPLNCHKAQPAHRVKDAEGTAKPLVLDSARWLGYLPAEPVRTFHAQKATNRQTLKAVPQPSPKAAPEMGGATARAVKWLSLTSIFTTSMLKTVQVACRIAALDS